MRPVLTKQQFIEKAKSIHGARYGYDNSFYINAVTKIQIECFLHGIFNQTPNAHLNGQGCPECSTINNRLTQEEFIKRSNLKHNNFYDYSKVRYLDSRTKVIIICPIHGDFYQTPDIHIRGSKCPICHKEKDKLSLNQFIEKAKSVHGDKYDYSKVIYKNSYTKINITCPKHGDFEQEPGNHLFGSGCRLCFLKNKNLTTEQFIEKAKVIHKDKYDYSKVKYINSKTKVTIICPEHGDFYQKANGHLNGHGCPKCNSSKGELILEEIFKKHNIQYEPQYNIPEIINNYEIDFYLPEYRCLIEFHGRQHYEYIPFFHDGNYSFEDQKTRDNMVRDAAIRWKYNYLEFNYKQLKYMSKEQFEEMVINKIKA